MDAPAEKIVVSIEDANGNNIGTETFKPIPEKTGHVITSELAHVYGPGFLRDKDGDTVLRGQPVPAGNYKYRVTAAAAASTGAGGGAGGADYDKPWVVTFKKGNAVHDVTFNGVPSWLALCGRVEVLYPELAAEEFCLKAGKLQLDEANWPGRAADVVATTSPHLTIGVISLCKPFSAFKQDEAYKVLETTHQYVDEEESAFPPAVYEPTATTHLSKLFQDCTGLHTHADIVAHTGKELALRCCKTDPERYNKEASKKELISPVMFAVAALAGDVRVEAEYSVHGLLGRGMIDYVIVYQHFSIVVVEGKLHETLEEHLGQLAAEMRSARDQYKRVYMSKRKHEDEGDFKKVPSFGVLSNGTRYIFYKYNPADKLLIQRSVQAQLRRNITASEASEQVLPIIQYLVHIVQQQMQSMDSCKKAKTG